MSTNPPKVPRGRPKTLDRDHVLDVAMHAYWREGVDGISLNEICRQCKVSKPGLYREFGNEDGLMTAVLEAYQKQIHTPLMQLLTTETSFSESLENLVGFVTTANDSQDAPSGCLLVKMRESQLRVGETTRAQIDRAQVQVLSLLEDWVERSKAKGEFSADLTSQFAATYIDAQLCNALSLMARGEPSERVKRILTVAFSMLR